MNKDLEKKFDEEFAEEFFDLHYRFCPLRETDDKRQAGCNSNKEQVLSHIKSFIDRHFVAREDHNDIVQKHVAIEEQLYTKQQILEIVGEDEGGACSCAVTPIRCSQCGYNQAKQEIRDKLK